MTSYILTAFIYFHYNTTLQDMSRKFANTGKNFPAEWQNTHFTVSGYTAKLVHVIL